MPKDFVYLTDISNNIIESVSYFSSHNFAGRKIPGYEAPKIICTKTAAQALSKANQHFQQLGYTIVVYDGYRPTSSVEYFNTWAKDLSDIKMKRYYYPTLEKNQILEQGYIAPIRSSHSRGSTFDLTLIENGKTVQEPQYSSIVLKNAEVIPFLDDNTIDAGASFDLFHPVSNHGTELITQEQTQMRNLLRDVLDKYGFEPYQPEWWHYTLRDEPYPDQYFNFDIKNKT